MNTIREIQKLNQRELENVTPPSASWHTDYRDTAYIHIGGLSFDLTEGDIVTIFSQYGEPVWLKLARDKETGKSRGFAWLKYEDQRSCDLAVDNLGGATILERVLKVDHTRYKKRDDEEDDDEKYNIKFEGAEEEGRSPKRRRASQSGSEEERLPLKEELELAELMRNHDDDDPMKAYLIDEKKAEVAEALARQNEKGAKPDKHQHRHRHRHHSKRDRESRDERDDRRHGRSRRELDGKASNGHEERRDYRDSRLPSRHDDNRDDDRRHRSRHERGYSHDKAPIQ